MDLNALNERYKKFLALSNHDRPLVAIRAPRKGADSGKCPKAPADLKRRWTDVEYVVGKTRFEINSLAYIGEAFPVTFANLGPDIMGALCGCEIEFGETTSWSVPNILNWEGQKEIMFNAGNHWFKLLQEITAALVEDAKYDYVVGVTDLHPGMDALVSLRGSENVCIDIFDAPDELKKYTMQIFDVFKEVYNRQYAITAKYIPHTSNWLGVLGGGRQYVVSCDFSCMIGQSDFEEFVIPELLEEIKWLDTPIYHLDGVMALKHLDRLLSIEKLNGIQWVPGAGAKPMREWLDVLKKIQDAGKTLVIDVTPGDIKPICESLKPEGVLMQCYAPTEEIGNDILETVTKIYKSKRK